MSDKRDYALATSDKTIDKAVTALEANGFSVTVVDTVADARTEVLNTIPEGSEVLTNASETLRLSGLVDDLNGPKYVSVRAKFAPLAGKPEKAVEMRQLGSAMDYAVGSVHALTEDGQAIIATASGSQIPGYAYGASHVIWVVGSQKIVKDLNEGLHRLESHTFPLEDARALVAYGGNSHIGKILIYRKEARQRVHIVIIKEAIGY